MGDNIVNANGSSSDVPYVILILLVQIMLQFLVLAPGLELFLPYFLLDNMSSLFRLLLVMCTLLFFS
jgi:hypothetical protein